MGMLDVGFWLFSLFCCTEKSRRKFLDLAILKGT